MTSEQEFLKMIQLSGIKNWYDNGFKGKPLKVLCCQDDTTKHGRGIIRIYKDCYKDSVFINGAHFLNFKDGRMIESSIVISGVKYDFEEYVINNKFDIVFSSSSGYASTHSNQDWLDSCERMYDATGVIFNNSAGNVGENKAGEELSHRFPTEHSILWGSLGISDTGVVKRLNSCLSGLDLMFMSFAPLIGGTSAANPFGTAIESFLMSRYNIIHREELIEALKLISKDYGTVGKDIYYGYGVPILPDYNKRFLQIDIDKREYYVDGEEYTLPCEPVLINSVTYVPVRAISEGLGKTVVWYENLKTVTISDSTKTLSYKLGENGVYRTPSGTTMIPLRLVSEEFGCKVAWVTKYKRILILEV